MMMMMMMMMMMIMIIMIIVKEMIIMINNSRVSGDLRRHVPHVTSLWCDIFMQHRHISIVESSYNWISWYMSICIQNCVRCNWLWCFGNTAIQSAVDSPHKRPLILCPGVFFAVCLSKLLKQQSSCRCWETSCVTCISYIFPSKFKVHPQVLKFIKEINHDHNLINFALWRYVLSSSLLGRSSGP